MHTHDEWLIHTVWPHIHTVWHTHTHTHVYTHTHTHVTHSQNTHVTYTQCDTHIHTHTHTHTHTVWHLHITHIHIHTHMYTHGVESHAAHIHTCMLCGWTHIHIHIHIHTYTYTYTHTHTIRSTELCIVISYLVLIRDTKFTQEYSCSLLRRRSFWPAWPKISAVAIHVRYMQNLKANNKLCTGLERFFVRRITSRQPTCSVSKLINDEI